MLVYLQKKILEVKKQCISDEVKSDKANLATKEDLANTKAEMIKWMFIFGVGQLAAMFGLLYFFFKK